MNKRLCLACLAALSLPALAASLHKALKLSVWDIPAGHYSGLTAFGNGDYAVVSDKGTMDGFHIWTIQQDPRTGQVNYVSNRAFKGQVPQDTNADGISLRDTEDIVYCPQRGTFFICGEGYQDIIEMDRQGNRTGYELPIPDYLRATYPNYGFEALAYDEQTTTFYTTTENSLPADGAPTSPLNHQETRLHLQTFVANGDGTGFSASHQYIYTLDGATAKRMGRTHRHGVVAMTALGNGRLAVLEREAYVSKYYTGSWVKNKIYIVDTTSAQPDETLQKQLVTTWTTNLKATRYNWANYEGMCLGQPLTDGRQTLLLLSDSQGGFGIGPLHLRDYIRVIVL